MTYKMTIGVELNCTCLDFVLCYQTWRREVDLSLENIYNSFIKQWCFVITRQMTSSMNLQWGSSWSEKLVATRNWTRRVEMYYSSIIMCFDPHGPHVIFDWPSIWCWCIWTQNFVLCVPNHHPSLNFIFKTFAINMSLCFKIDMWILRNMNIV